MITLSPAVTADIPDLARIHIAGWKATYDGLVDPDFLNALSVEKREKDWEGWLAAGDSTVLIARQDGAAAGFISVGRMRTPPPGSSHIRPTYSAEVYAIYLLSEFWRQGVGRALMHAAAAELKTQKHSSLCLWVIEQNTRAKSFYDHLSGQKIGKKKAEIGSRTLTEICYGWRDTSVLLNPK
jgi:GNAT superfamily N-acetyltransferase